MGNTIDNTDWCKQHEKNLKKMKSIDEVFDYVRKYHPNFGCAYWNSPGAKFAKTGSAENLAKYADAVVVARMDLLPPESFDRKFDKQTVQSINLTSLANIAFIAINHPSEEMRQKCHKMLLECQKFVDVKTFQC
jgi:hypothetical protein